MHRYDQTKTMSCANQTFEGCAAEAGAACDTLAGCT
eukprot:COSAG05_NODE_14721_length_389_cov_0.893103_2_plen_35_part_01